MLLCLFKFWNLRFILKLFLLSLFQEYWIELELNKILLSWIYSILLSYHIHSIYPKHTNSIAQLASLLGLDELNSITALGLSPTTLIAAWFLHCVCTLHFLETTFTLSAGDRTRCTLSLNWIQGKPSFGGFII